jgi:DNA-binding SARP family transcriptional activator/Flp pilus assembly protein TadD
MTPKLEFCLLGPVLVRRGGVALPVPRGRQRAVLAVLLLNAGRVVSVGEIAETLWGAAPLPSASATVRNYVKRLRRVLGDADQARIVTRSPGYVIRVEPGELDVARFEAQLEGARDAAQGGSWEAAADQARAALALWRGEPLADVESEALALREVPRLAELRLQAAELRIDADLRLGRHGVVIAELERMAAAHPLREHLHTLLMLALYRDGRQAEALAAYRHARRVLVDELGAEPGAELRGLHRQILTARPVLAGPEPGRLPPGDARRAGATPGLVVPRELPGPVPQFVGRAAELADLTGMLERASAQRPRTLVISAIAGMAGVGKTALAMQWAHQVADRFPDGQLHVNLRGYDPGRPVSAADALAGFLRSLGVAEQDIPARTGERAARYRSLLAGRRMLIMIDNARNVEQVRPLLPGSPSCVAVVTSRDALAGLAARDGARRLDLGLLPLAEAVGLLRALIGERVDAEPEAVVTLAGYCARLPLALRVAAERAATSPGVPLADVTSELADRQERLDLLDAAGDQLTAVRAVFSWSVQHLDDEAARAFRLLGLHPGADFDAYAAAALTDTTLRRARWLLDRLGRAHLIQPTGTSHCGMHDLLRAYAAEQAADQDSEPERRAALTRLFDHCLATAAVAAGALFPADPDQPAPPQPAGLVPPLTSPAAALAWLDAQRSTLVAVAAHAADHGWPGHAIGLAATIFRYLDVGHFTDAAVIHSHARRAAARAGDRTAEAAALMMLGAAGVAQGRLRQATSHLQQALALCRKDGDRTGEARALGNLGMAAYCQGRYQQSAGCHRKALTIYLDAGDRVGEARELHGLGVVDLRQGRYERAAGHLQRSLALFRDGGLRSGEAYVLGDLGELELRQGRYVQAAGHLRRSLMLGRETGSRLCLARALACLGAAELRRGRRRQAIARLRQSLALHSQVGNCSGQAEALNGLGEAFLAANQVDQASARHAAALALAIQCSDKHEQARAQSGLASARQARCGRSQAAVVAQGDQGADGDEAAPVQLGRGGPGREVEGPAAVVALPGRGVVEVGLDDRVVEQGPGPRVWPRGKRER